MSQFTPILQTASKLIDDLSHGRFYEFAKSHEYPTVAEYAARLEECVEQIRMLCEENRGEMGPKKGDGNKIT